jgi:hypothetical protein|tara:strand:+ start:116 stop:217 length:102 start_codon:yes stop_codon:yes gene_type:complete
MTGMLVLTMVTMFGLGINVGADMVGIRPIQCPQ